MKNKRSIFFLIMFIFIFIARPLSADSGVSGGAASQILLESKVDRAQVTVGDPIHYSITITAHKGVALTLPQLGSNLGEFDILDYQAIGPTEKEGRIIQTITYTIAVYDTGAYHIPPVEIRYKTPEGEEKTILAEGIEIKVKVVAPEKAADIRDIKEPLEMGRNWASYRKALPWVAASLLLALLASWGIWFYRKKRSCGASDNAVPLLPAHEAAMAELKKIGDTLLANNQIREFYFQLSEIMRRYFSRRYQINALEATTEELIRQLQAQSIPSQLTQAGALISNFLNGCDLVKFAKYVPQGAENEHIYQMAFQIVDSTRVVDDTRPAAAPSEAAVQQMQNHQG